MQKDLEMLGALLEEARCRGLSEHDAITALARVLIHNEGYRRKPSRQGKRTRYDLLLEETQPALALAWKLLREHQGHPSDEEGGRS